MSLLPSRPDVSPDGEPRVVGLDSDEADDLMAALSSTTARRLLAELHEKPAPPSEVASRADTSLQNAQYHLEKLEGAGAVEVVGTAYSEKGREMNVYGPADSPLVIFAGQEDRASGLKAALTRLFGGFAALAVGAIAIQEVFGENILGFANEGAAPGGDDAAAPTEEPGAGGGQADEEDADGGDGAESTTDDATTDDATTEEATPDDVTPEPTPEAGQMEAETPTPAAGADMPVPEPTPEAGAAATSTPEPMAATPTPTPESTPVPEAFEGLLATGLPPGLAFFLGGATVLTLVVATTYLRTRP